MTLEVVYKYVVKLIALFPNCWNLTIDGSTVTSNQPFLYYSQHIKQSVTNKFVCKVYKNIWNACAIYCGNLKSLEIDLPADLKNFQKS